MSGYDRKGYYVAIVALIVGILSALIGYFGIRASWEIAEATGGLDKPDIEVGILGHALPFGKPIRIIIGASELSTNAVPVVGAIPFSFRSSGKRALDALTITLQYHAIFKRSALETLEVRKAGDFSATEFQKAFTASGDQSFVSYRVPMLNPGIATLIAEPIFVQETTIRDSVTATTRDGVRVTVPFQASFSMNFGLTVTGRDIPLRSFPISISAERANSVEDLKKGELMSLVGQEQRHLRQKLAFFSYLAALITSSPTGRVFLVYVPTEAVSATGVTVLGPKGTQEVSVAQFPLLNWRLLMQSGNEV